MNHLSIPLAVFVLLATQCCCCCGLGGLLGGPEFTTGDFPNVPQYPGSVQTTESNILFDSMLGAFEVFGDAEWKHYTTGDSKRRVLSWYEENLPDHGWRISDDEQSDSLTFLNTDDPTVMLVVLAAGPLDLTTQDTDILIGRIDVLSGE
jgi:hypothetical protein